MFFGNYSSPGYGGFGNRAGLGFNMNNGFNGGMSNGFFGQNRRGMQNFNPQNMYNFPPAQPHNRINQPYIHQNQPEHLRQMPGWQHIPQQMPGQPQMPGSQMPMQPQMPFSQMPGPPQTNRQQMPGQHQMHGSQMPMQPKMPFSQMPGPPQTNRQQMPGQPQMPGSQIPMQPQMPHHPNMNGFQNQKDGAPGGGIEQNPPDTGQLKNVGTFMGYPEYALADTPQAEKAAPVAGVTGLLGDSNPQDSHAAPSDNINDKIKQFSQNEKNSSEFYSNLAENTNNHATRDALGSIAKRARNRSARLGEIHKIHSGAEFSPVDKEIRTNVGLNDGLRLALREESLALMDCAEMAETTQNQAVRDKLNTIILEKLCQINELNYLKEL